MKKLKLKKFLKQIHHAVSVTNPSDGFISVARKRRRNYKQFFLSGIAKNVNEDQIFSYLVERNVTPHNITIFQSKRVETFSAKIRIPSASSAIVLQEGFWPKFILCKPWLQKPKENQRRRKTSNNNNTLMGNYATYVYSGKYYPCTYILVREFSLTHILAGNIIENYFQYLHTGNPCPHSQNFS